jgi:hypothetical protein
MATEHRIGAPAIAALLAIFLASSCGPYRADACRIRRRFGFYFCVSVYVINAAA